MNPAAKVHAAILAHVARTPLGSCLDAVAQEIFMLIGPALADPKPTEAPVLRHRTASFDDRGAFVGWGKPQ